MGIALIDYNMGNIKSVENALKKLGAEVWVSSDPKIIDRSRAFILPGVGAFSDAYRNLEKLELIETIKKNMRKKPFLGICLGMQLLFEYSMEDGKNEGLSVFKGYSDRIPPIVKVPHMGWNDLNILKQHSRLFRGIESGDYFYFVHSYHIKPEDSSIVSSTVNYGTDIVSSIEKDNIFGFQLHPEKSSGKGQVILKNFLELTGEL